MEKSIYDTLDNIAKKIIREMGDKIKAGYGGRPSIASGRLLNSLDYQILLSESGEWSLTFEYIDYGRFVDKGRNPGRFPPKAAIQNWMRLKGINEDKLWPIMVKIKKGGFYSKKLGSSTSGNQSISIYARPKGINFTDPFTKNIDLQKLQESIALTYGEYLIKSVKEPNSKNNIFK